MFNWLKKLWVKITEFFTKKPTPPMVAKSQSAKKNKSMTKEEFDKLKVAIDEAGKTTVISLKTALTYFKTHEKLQINHLASGKVMMIQKDHLTIYCLRTSEDKVTIKILSTGDPFYAGCSEINNTYTQPIQRYYQTSSQVPIEKKDVGALVQSPRIVFMENVPSHRPCDTKKILSFKTKVVYATGAHNTQNAPRIFVIDVNKNKMTEPLMP